ncbi:MAG: hypothetical protein U0797_19420 [Gemmataceae bacterium]
MSDQPKSKNQGSTPKYLPTAWLIAFVVGVLCFLPALAGALANEVDGWLRLAIWVATWGLMFVVSWIITRKYANPSLPTICGAMVGLTIPRPSDEWIRQLIGERWGKATEIGLAMICVVIGLAIAQCGLPSGIRHESSAQPTWPVAEHGHAPAPSLSTNGSAPRSPEEDLLPLLLVDHRVHAEHVVP